MAAATGWDRTIFRAQDTILPLTLPDEDGSGHTWQYTVRKGNSSAALLTITGAAITATYDAVSGDTSIEITLTDTETDITTTQYRHSLWRIDTNNTYPYAVGQLTIAPSSQDV